MTGLMRRILIMTVLLAAMAARGQTYSYRYWFDNNTAAAVSGSATGEAALTVDVSGLSQDHTHALRVQAYRDGRWSAVRTLYFLRATTAVRLTSTTGRYWFDNDVATAQTAPTVDGLIDLDVSALATGMHAIHYQTFAADGTPSVVRTAYFLYERNSKQSATGRYWFDNDVATSQAAPTVDGLIDLDVSALATGMHAVHYQTFAADGTASVVRTQYFLLTDYNGERLTCELWIDDAEEHAQSLPVKDYEVELDISSLEEGTHHVTICVFDGAGVLTARETLEFTIPAEGPSGILQIDMQRTDDGVWYNLSGQRITTPKNGVFVKNGKKVVMK